MPSKVVLLADDLTGACDAAVHFAMRGLPAAAAVSMDCVHGDVPVWAVNTESRDMGREAIERLMLQAGALLPIGPETVIFKKIDSTLRGNAGIETAAAMKAFACERAVFTPALPALGRTVESGVLRVASSPDFQPVEVAGWLRSQGVDCGANVMAMDAACDADLDRIVAHSLASGKRILWVGSSGLAAALARSMGGSFRPPLAHGRGSDCEGAGSVLFAIGSNHPATLAQLELLRLARAGPVLLRIPRGEVSEGEIREWMSRVQPAALVLSGGDTASLVCRSLGAQRIELENEIIPGVPWGILDGGLADGIPVATKSGGFGAPEALVRVADFFRT